MTVKNYMFKVYSWMFIGVFITFITAFLISNSTELVFKILGTPMLPIIFLIAQLGIVIVLSARLMKLSSIIAKILFMIYSILTGITFSVLFIAYELPSLVSAFLIAGIFFGCLSIIGLTTKKDLSKIGTICIVALFVLIIFELLAYFIFKWSTDTMLISAIGLIIFAGLTAWDNQKSIKLYNKYKGNEKMIKNLSIYSALDLYLDFINIFLYILRFVGKEK